MHARIEDKEAVLARLPSGTIITAKSYRDLYVLYGEGMTYRRFRRAVESLGYDGRETSDNRIGLWRPYANRSGGRRQVQVLRFTN